jgi:hypothetical protein
VRCAGSPNFLKRLFGVGYILTCVKRQGADSRAVIATVQRFVPGSVVNADVGAELSFKMPLEAARSLPALFQTLDSDPGVETYALSITNMESIFLTIAREDEAAVAAAAAEKAARAEVDPRNPKAPPLSPVATIDFGEDASQHQPLMTIGQMRERALKAQGSSWGHFTSHFATLMQKRLRLAWRDRRGICYQFCIPIIVLLIGMAVLTQRGSLCIDRLSFTNSRCDGYFLLFLRPLCSD